MKKRLSLIEKGGSAMRPLFAVKAHLDQSPIGNELMELIFLRASQINGCAACLDMHSKALLANGESSQRLFTLNAWRETSLFSEKERAALAWTEAVTLLAGNHVPDNIYEDAAKHFSETELLDLTLAVGFINVANRLNIAFGTTVGTYDIDEVVKKVSQTA